VDGNGIRSYDFFKVSMCMNISVFLRISVSMVHAAVRSVLLSVDLIIMTFIMKKIGCALNITPNHSFFCATLTVRLVAQVRTIFSIFILGLGMAND
jgi:hypothetical protein